MSNPITQALDDFLPISKPLLGRLLSNKELLNKLIWDGFTDESYKEKDLLTFLEDIEDIGGKARLIVSEIKVNLESDFLHRNQDMEGDEDGR
ncbi:hypothetical protein [Candidatus Lokiarchaeum ossiferum]|uniref:hypothetical protein n=1 Tax=Candidatus Lokiarchaeum ossiferum TaxID=2951803 RepID=UPI00352E6649